MHERIQMLVIKPELLGLNIMGEHRPVYRNVTKRIIGELVEGLDIDK